MGLRVLVAVFATFVLAPTFGTGCDLVNTPTKVGNGQLYTSGDGKYDPYFNQVHQEQLAAATWSDDSKSARKPIITALNLRPGASNSTIFSATREKRGEASLTGAIDETTSAERALAKKLATEAARLEELYKRGEELKKQVAEERRNLAADKADEQKVKSKDELKHEMSAAVDAVGTMLSDAQHGAKEADELARKLRGKWSGKEDEEAPPADPPKEEKPAEKPVAKPAAVKKAAPKPAPKVVADKPVEEKAAPKPKPQPQKPADEVFNP